ncbi:FGGY family carbohydrate kinase [Actinomyces israelii]|uniref:FGGY family carbohydrate kinase n=1 Tax=Actinomyces israelii TaxID=1659 RepID=A0ABT4I7X0_9ACTO|nr:FGGY family carbohydrate kinase [Actinomyces israelii]MCZ0857611.1 FGGY family carbohydrate kinase [Actinomyces israelii]
MSSTSSTAITPSSTAKDVLIGIDVGTSSTKVAAFTRDAAVLADQTRDYRLVVDAPGFVEQDPNEWWEAITLATRAVVETVGAHRVAGVGVSGQSWSAVPVDADGTVLANTPIWMDTRSQNICDDLVARVGADRILAVSGNRLAPTYTTGKIIWFQRNRPEVYRAARWFLQSSSFIVLRLTGRVSQDVSQSYGIHAWDTATGEYRRWRPSSASTSPGSRRRCPATRSSGPSPPRPPPRPGWPRARRSSPGVSTPPAGRSGPAS